MPKVRSGLDVLVAQEFAPLRGLRVGLVTHPAAVDALLRHSIELFATAKNVVEIQMIRIFHDYLI